MSINTDFVAPLEAHGYRPTAKLRPRSPREIGASSWCIGCETVDRRYVDFNAVAPYLDELGATQVRLQAGWARCEPNADGVYDFGWLDECVEGCIARGVRPWLQTSYGNPAYEGGGGIGLTQGIPTSHRALAAWDAWVEAMARRYTAVLMNPPFADGADIKHILHARIIRGVVPEAQIFVLSMAGRSPDYAGQAMATVAEAGGVDLVTAALFHGYPHNPDDAFDDLPDFCAAVRRHIPHARMIQGESGAPSERNPVMAMRDFEWSPRKQAAWDLRRMLAHHARGNAMNLFQLSDMHYRKEGGARFEGKNSKGLLDTRPDGSVFAKKPSFFMAQHVFTLFDARYPPGAHAALPVEAPAGVTGWTWAAAGSQKPTLAAWWRSDTPPELQSPPLTTAMIADVGFEDPVLVDFLSGQVFDLPTIGQAGELPCTDVPLALAERATLPLQ